MKRNKLCSAALSLLCSIALVLSGCADQPTSETKNSTNLQSISQSENNESIATTEMVSMTETVTTIGTAYIINMNTKKFHYPDCPSVEQMNEKNKREYTGDRNVLVSRGYSPCHRCEP